MTSVRPRGSSVIMITVAFAAFLATFNETFLNVALVPIMDDFSVGAETAQWLTTAYMLAAAIMVPITGFLYRKVPTKHLFMIALMFLFLGAVVGFLAPSFAILLIGRVVQALGTGMIIPIGMNVTLAVAPREKLGFYLGAVSAMTTLGPSFGPIAAGTMLGITSWHMLFVAFGVMVAVLMIAGLLSMKNVSELTNPVIDMPSTVLISVALIGILYGISSLFSDSSLMAVAALVLGVGSLAGFLIRQTKLSTPLIDIRPFKNRSFSAGIVIVTIGMMTVFSMNIVLPLFMQGSLGFTAFEAASTLLPACILSCVLAPLAGKVYDRFGIRVVVPVGLCIIVGFTFALSRLTQDATSLQIVGLYAPVIVGCSLTLGPIQSFALASLKPELHAHGVTIMSTFFQIAGCVGSSVFIGVLAAQSKASLELGASAEGAQAMGFSAACLVACGLALVALVISLYLAREEFRRFPKNEAVLYSHGVQ